MKITFDVEIPTCREGVFVPVGFGGPSDILKTVLEAERLGYETVWATDFLTPTPDYKIPDASPPGWYEPIITLAYCAARTSRIRLGTGVLLAPLRDPVILAKQVATIDQFSSGRFVLGLGIGMCRDEYAAVKPRDRKARRGVLLDECIETLRLLLSPDPGRVEYKGEYTEFRSIRLDPRPIQNPFPIYVPGRTPEALERAAHFGLGIMVPAPSAPERIRQLTKLIEERRANPKSVDVIAEGEIRIAHTREEAIKAYRLSRQGKFRIDIRGANPDQVLAANWIGTSSEICEKINGLARQGVTHFNVLHISGDTMGERLEQMQMFSEEIIPHITG